MTTLTAPKSLSSSITASTKALTGIELVNQNLRVFSENLKQKTRGIGARLKAFQEGVKASPYYLLHLLSSARQSALKWLLERLNRLTGQALKAFRNKAKTVFRQTEKVSSLTKTFPTSSSVNP